jgi:hypothetical protein
MSTPAPSAANEDHESNLIHAKTIRGYPGVEPRQPTYVYVAACGRRPLLPMGPQAAHTYTYTLLLAHVRLIG